MFRNLLVLEVASTGELHEYIPDGEMITKAAELFFEPDSTRRPDAHAVADLVRAGLTEEQLIAAGEQQGHEAPDMPLTLAELDQLFQPINTMSDRMATDYDPSTIRLFADRDANIEGENFQIRYHELPSHIIPASGGLWIDLEKQHADDPQLTADFLAQYEITEEAVRNPDQKFALFDTGFQGTIGRKLDEAVQRVYGISLLEAGRLDLPMASTVQGSLGHSIVDFDFKDAHRFLRSVMWLGPTYIEAQRQAGFDSSAPIANAMQLMPQYHSAYYGVVRQADGTPQAWALHYDKPVQHQWHLQPNAEGGVSLALTIVETNGVDPVDIGRHHHNDSIINPFGAAIIQYRIIKNALETPPVYLNGLNQ